ncbi:hypothetical protein [Paenibacillus thiaminolyticus]|uniref:hypothetical protein n=1 Tax=Paenibacillus thiaminolyticus TaxID=49283 RepID=UPI002543D6D8|nr:hypothetical protein [Paenibacillus thiaminolyticus]WII39955.1 hypothetical protein O0V01_13080 [Paenibacillus thiaminolyticus]
MLYVVRRGPTDVNKKVKSKGETVPLNENGIKQASGDLTMKKLSICPVTRDNWEKAIQIKIHEEHVPFVPSIYEALTYAYIKPWDEALDPFLI